MLQSVMDSSLDDNSFRDSSLMRRRHCATQGPGWMTLVLGYVLAVCRRQSWELFMVTTNWLGILVSTELSLPCHMRSIGLAYTWMSLILCAHVKCVLLRKIPTTNVWLQNCIPLFQYNHLLVGLWIWFDQCPNPTMATNGLWHGQTADSRHM